MIRTRFAPSPTGFLHIGGARTALFSWAYAKRNNGKFILRIEDTDIERSTQESVDSIIHAMQWLNLTHDEGPFYQTHRMERYKEVITQMLKDGTAYYCYCSKERLDNMREEQKAKGLKPKYDGKCLHNPEPNSCTNPVVRFNNPKTGSVIWDDLVKGKIEFNNAELDDLIIARSDKTPTYNFCVVVDDLDMQISHVIRGDDHVNNTPRQINILKALKGTIPVYAHVPMILREDGQKMSKRHDAVSVMDYKKLGILPEALLNYLAKLCWGHGDDEIFTLEQFVNWFDIDNVSSSPARFDMKKLFWVNAEHIKMAKNQHLLQLINEYLASTGINSSQLYQNLPHLDPLCIIELVKSRSDSINKLSLEVAYFYQPIKYSNLDADKFLTQDAINILKAFSTKLTTITNWELDTIKAMIKEFCNEQNIKMPALGMPLRLKICGTTQTPSIDNIIYLMGRDEVIKRITS